MTTSDSITVFIWGVLSGFTLGNAVAYILARIAIKKIIKKDV